MSSIDSSTSPTRPINPPNQLRIPFMNAMNATTAIKLPAILATRKTAVIAPVKTIVDCQIFEICDCYIIFSFPNRHHKNPQLVNVPWLAASRRFAHSLFPISMLSDVVLLLFVSII